MSDYKELVPYQELGNDVILEGYRGSHAHGTFLPSTDEAGVDDIDLMSIVVRPKDYYLGLKKFETREIMINEWDLVIYDIQHYMKLLCYQNPNVLALLWLEPQFYTKITPAGQMLLDNRKMFATKACHDKFVGYAKAQLYKMTNPATGVGQHQPYMGQKRKALLDKFGYDCKNAAHLIRLLRMSVEFLRDGNLQVLRPDAAELIEVKQGRRPLVWVREEADRLFRLADAALAASTLPEDVDYEAAGNLCIRIIERHYEPVSAK